MSYRLKRQCLLNTLPIFFSLSFLTLGCGTSGVSQKPSPPLETPKVRAVEPSIPRERPPEKMPELVISQVEEEKKVPEKIFSLTLRDANIREVLFSLSQQVDYNVIVDPEVSGRTTVDLKSVTLEEALDSLLTPLNLEYKIEKKFIRVTSRKLETRIFRLNYITTKRTGTDTLSATTGGARAGRAGAVGGGGAGAAGGGGGVGGGSDIEVESEDEADLWEEIEDGLKDLISAQGKFVINKVAGTIMVTDLRSNLNQVAAFLEEVEGSIQRQVFIQAKILEVVLSEKYQYGINWSTVIKTSLFRESDIAINQRLATGLNFFQVNRTGEDFTSLMDAISIQGDVNILSSPQVSVLNNQTAVITVGTQDVFFTRQQAIPTAILAPQQLPSQVVAVTPQFITVGVVLYVTPQISKDGRITMTIHPSISERTGTATSPDGITVPIVDVRETNTVVSVENGQTIIMAGLMQDKAIKNQTSVPLLGNIPLVGGFFKQSIQEKKKTELIIMLTPTIVVGSSS